MGKLMERYRQAMAKSKDKPREAQFDVLYPTGFITLDYLNGTMIHVDYNGIKEDYEAIGIVDGTSNTFISRPGAGKSTLVTQIIGNMMRQYPQADCYIDDIEGSLPMARKEFLLGLTTEEFKERIFFRNDGITTENVYKQIRFIRDDKLEHADQYMYDTGLYDTTGNRIFKMYPTFYFIDSFAMLMPEDVMEDDELKNNGTAANSAAKMNTLLIKKIAQCLKEANIIMFVINHIMDDIQMGFAKKPQQIAGLKEGERLPGGKTCLYLANNLFRIDHFKKLKDTEDFGINGSIVKIGIVKSRTNADFRSVPLIFNKDEGRFDNVLSILQYLLDEGYVSGVGVTSHFDCLPEVRFSKKTFKEKLMESPELQQAFAMTSKKALSSMLSDTSHKEVANQFDINGMIRAS